MKLIRFIFVTVLTLFLLCGCSESAGDPSEFKVGDLLDQPEKMASLDSYEAITIYEESEDKTYSSVFAAKKTGDYTVYFSKIEHANQPELELLTYEKGETCNSYCKFNDPSLESGGIWQKENDTPAVAKNRFAAIGFGINPELSASKYKKLEDTVINGKKHYAYEVTFTYKSGDVEEQIISVDKETGIWMRSEVTVNGETTVYNVTSVQAKDVHASQLCDPVVIPKQDLYEKDGVTITVKPSESATPEKTASLVFEVQNNRDSDIRIYSHRLRINGLYVGQNVINGTISAKSTSAITVDIPADAAEISKIYTVKEIDTRLYIENVHTETTSDGSFVTADSVLTEDTGDLTIRTDYKKDFKQEIRKDGTVIFDKKGVKLTFMDLKREVNGDVILRVHLDNDFSELIRVRLYIKKINGQKFEESERFRMATDSEGFTGFRLYAEDLSEFEDIESIELDYAVYYGDMDFGTLSYNKTKTLLESSSPFTITVK